VCVGFLVVSRSDRDTRRAERFRVISGGFSGLIPGFRAEGSSSVQATVRRRVFTLRRYIYSNRFRRPKKTEIRFPDLRQFCGINYGPKYTIIYRCAQSYYTYEYLMETH